MDTATGLRRCADETTARHLRLGQVARSQSLAQLSQVAQLGIVLLKRWLRWD